MVVRVTVSQYSVRQKGVRSDRGRQYAYTPIAGTCCKVSPYSLKSFRDKAEGKTLLLDDLLRLGSDAKLEVVAFCYDSFVVLGSCLSQIHTLLRTFVKEDSIQQASS